MQISGEDTEEAYEREPHSHANKASLKLRDPRREREGHGSVYVRVFLSLCV